MQITKTRSSKTNMQIRLREEMRSAQDKRKCGFETCKKKVNNDRDKHSILTSAFYSSCVIYFCLPDFFELSLWRTVDIAEQIPQYK